MAVLLSVSGGITLFQALVVLFANSLKEFNSVFNPDDTQHTANKENDNEDDLGTAWLVTTACFGGGIFISYLVDLVVHKLTPGQNVNGTARLQPDRLSNEEGRIDIKPPVEFMQSQQGSDVFIKMDEAAREKLQRMGVLSALAVGIHNIPEGMATFVASTAHAWLGLSLAIGVALHNIAEGIAVATPIYFATSSPCRALLWCFLSALAQHLGGLIAFASMGERTDNWTRGVLYGLCAGMLAGISLKEIIPTAYMYANGRPHLVSAGSLGGMFLMSAGLILFKYMGV
uniref:Zinc (Zn2)-Iron (Fe2) Permease (ZIP) Family n=1 Tax=Hyaloperonospora arabidopsidis (strain Emoy2) TaxID=559515 RepID=M4BLM2_HYAAE